PDFNAVGRGLPVLEQQVEFIQVAPGINALGAVGRYPVPDLILHQEHAHRLELLAQGVDVEADHPLVQLYVGAPVENLQGTGHVYFQGGGYLPGVGIVLGQQRSVQIAQHRHVFRYRVGEIGGVDFRQAAVDDGPLLRGHLPFHDELAEGEDKVALENEQLVEIVAFLHV